MKTAFAFALLLSLSSTPALAGLAESKSTIDAVVAALQKRGNSAFEIASIKINTRRDSAIVGVDVDLAHPTDPSKNKIARFVVTSECSDDGCNIYVLDNLPVGF